MGKRIVPIEHLLSRWLQATPARFVKEMRPPLTRHPEGPFAAEPLKDLRRGSALNGPGTQRRHSRPTPETLPGEPSGGGSG